VNEGDARQAADARLFEQWLDGRVQASDPRVHDLFHRRPEWRELSKLASSDASANRAEPWTASTSAEDHRFVAECFAEARASGPLAMRVTGAEPRKSSPSTRSRRFLFALAALVLVGWSAWMWSQHEQKPERKPGQLLGSDASVDSLEPTTVAPDFSWFKWTEKRPLQPGEKYALTIWATDESGSRGKQIFADKTDATSDTINDVKRATWPGTVIWRVERVDSNGMTRDGSEQIARRSR